MANKKLSTSSIKSESFSRNMSDIFSGANVAITNSSSVTTNYNLTQSSAISLSTQGYYTLTVDKATNVLLQLWGAGGAGGVADNPSRGGAGGYTEGNVLLVPGTTYVVLVGQGGRAPAASTGRAFPDGGQNEQANSRMGGGGGSTRFGLYAQSGFNITNVDSNYNNTNALYMLIAGGGGGGCNYVLHSDGRGVVSGIGGGLYGQNGGAWYANSGEYQDSPGFGGTDTAGGNGGQRGRLSFSQSGSKYYGGNGSGGGGGGGWFGGGGARGYYSQGGGGSGYIGSSVTNGKFYSAVAGTNSHFISPNPRNNRPTSTTGFGGATGGSNAPDGGIVISLLNNSLVGFSADRPAFSAKELYQLGVTTNGDYWITGNGNEPIKAFCLMDRLGGGWTRIMRVPRGYDTLNRSYYGSNIEGLLTDSTAANFFNISGALFGNSNGTDLTVMYRVVGGPSGDFPGKLAGAMFRGYYLTQTWDAALAGGTFTYTSPEYSTDGINFSNYTGQALGKANDYWQFIHSNYTGNPADIGGYNYTGQASGIVLHGVGTDINTSIRQLYTYIESIGVVQGYSDWDYVDIYIRKDL
jgi:hypothetical protein